jgi:hypothetical protein
MIHVPFLVDRLAFFRHIFGLGPFHGIMIAFIDHGVSCKENLRHAPLKMGLCCDLIYFLRQNHAKSNPDNLFQQRPCMSRSIGDLQALFPKRGQKGVKSALKGVKSAFDS